MPKKFSTGNTKAVAARERKALVKEEDKKKKQQAEEDAYWEEDDKTVKKKLQRKEEREKKKQEVLDKKAESKALLEKELGSIVTSKKQPAVKVTRAQIQEETERRQAAATGGVKTKPQIETHLTKPLEENVNRLRVEGDEARSVDEAIRVLSIKDDEPVDLHPERRMKAAFNAFKEKRLPILKAENPSLRLSQLNQMIFKEWQTSPENPMNNV